MRGGKCKIKKWTSKTVHIFQTLMWGKWRTGDAWPESDNSQLNQYPKDTSPVNVSQFLLQNCTTLAVFQFRRKLSSPTAKPKAIRSESVKQIACPSGEDAGQLFRFY